MLSVRWLRTRQRALACILLSGGWPRHPASHTRTGALCYSAGAAVAVYPLAFYTSMRLAGVAVGTVVSIGSAPPGSEATERSSHHGLKIELIR
jgi:hypothetical protein